MFRLAPLQKRILIYSSLILLSFITFIDLLHANPHGGVVVAGSATINNTSPGLTQITQSTDKAVINWQGFSIDAGEHTQFIQPGRDSITLNRVTGDQASRIMGKLSANGNIMLLNPSGIIFGANSRVDVAGLVASTANISNNDFMSGQLNFKQNPAYNAGIVNEGTITVADRGLVALVAPSVQNKGKIVANLGKVALGAGNEFTVDLQGDELIHFTTGAKVTQQTYTPDGQLMKDALSNSGEIYANGGQVLLSAQAAENIVDNAVNMDGIIQAKSIGSQNGKVTISGGDTGNTRVSGKIDVSGLNANETGGTIKVLGQNVKLQGAQLNASGHSGGGKILIGGNYQGGGTEQRAKTTSVDANSQLNASAITKGNGGQVVVWSDQHTQYAGHIAARGGALSGNGGSAEVSGKEFLDFIGGVDLTATNGSMGELLLDPADLIITIDPHPYIPASGNITYTGGTSGISYLNIHTLRTALETANVVVQTAGSGTGNGDITIANPISWTSNNSLTLKAYRNIKIDAGIVNSASSGSSVINLFAGTSGTGTISGFGTVSNAGRPINFYYNPSTFPTPTNYSGNAATGNSITAYMLVNNVNQLQAMNTTLSGNYALNNDIVATATSGWNSGEGFVPIGSLFTPFTGKFDGMGFNIDGLTINRPNTNNVGLFGYISSLPGVSTIANVGLTNVNITAKGNVGALIGMNQGAFVNNAYSTGSITTINGSNSQGGLIGNNQGGAISNSYSSVNLSTGYLPTIIGQVGGLVGENRGAITNSYATGNINATQGGYTIGGLVGFAGFNNVAGDSPITNSYSTGNITGGNENIGGFAGYLSSTPVQNSYSMGSVQAISGAQDVGGFVGENDDSDISNSYSRGAVTVSGGSWIGGFAGINTGSITNSYSTGNVTALGSSQVGGFVGENFAGNISNAFSLGNIQAGSGVSNIGGFAGVNSNNATINNSYSLGGVSVTGVTNTNVGGLVGSNTTGASVTGSYWNTETSGLTTSAGGTGAMGRTTAEMMNPGNYSGWDFSPGGTWAIFENSSLPYLQNFYSGSNKPQIISGRAYTDVTAGSGIGGNVSIGLGQAGLEVATTSTGANGFYYFFLPTDTIAAQAPIITYTNSGTRGNSLALFADSGTSAIANNHIYGNALTARNYSSAELSSSSFGTPIVGNPGFGTRLLYNYNVADKAINLTIPSVIFQTAGTNELGAVQSGSGADFTLQGNLSTIGKIDFNGNLQIDSSAPITITTRGAGDLTIAGITSGAGMNMTLNGRNIFIDQIGSENNPLSSLNLQTGNLTLNGALNVTTLTGNIPTININTTDVNISRAIANLAASNATVNLAGGNYDEDVAIFKVIKLIGSGPITLNSLLDTAGLDLAGDFTLSGDVDLRNIVTLLGDTSIESAGAIKFGNTLNLNHNLSLSGNAVTLAQVNDTSSSKTLAIDTNTLTLNGALNDNINANNRISANASTLNINSTAIVINDAIRNLVDDGATINLAGGTYNQNVLINEAINLISLGTASLTSLSNTADMGLSGNFIANSFDFNAPVTLLGTTALTASAGDININGSLDGPHALTLTTSSPYATMINANIGSIAPLASLTINGTVLNAGVSTDTSGNQLYNGAVTLNGDADFNSSNGSLTFNDTIQGPYDLTLGAANGDITFFDAVGSRENRLGNLWITDARHVTAYDALEVSSFTQSAGTGTTSFGNTGVNALQDVQLNTLVINGAITAKSAVLHGHQGINAQVNVGSLSLGGFNGGTVNGSINGIDTGLASLLVKVAGNAVGNFIVNGCLAPSGCVASITTNSVVNSIVNADEKHGEKPLTCTAAAASNQQEGNKECENIMEIKDNA